MVSTAAWFDEVYQEETNVRTFRRNEQIKEVLFTIFKQSDKSEYLDGE